MNNEKTNEEVNSNQETISEEKYVELIKAVYHNGLVALKQHFDEVEGQVINKEIYGPVFVYRVMDDSNNGYECGFFLRELVAKFQSDGDPSEWMASFFVELMRTEGGKLLPTPPASEDEAKVFIDKVLVPQVITSIREEFAPQQVHADLDWNKEHSGIVFEAGFPEIKEGNNVCAFPLHVLFTQLLLNRDPADLVIQGLYKIREEHGIH
ncbi:hypothetical protein K0T92_04175 [Paenibacillus oenotherae]|uniref:Uncharacterized protein n=1 Tax=Paenibacillus oenotherae TaxID=1435645 RepID=A0ABS7D1W9_9BACL|nr:hypothetical protein [Paenibacillus oenotherae]MBW7473929.1 hypothetical protein [Paenibacillus oenotherae]